MIPLLALEAGLRADCLAVSQHRLNPARVQVSGLPCVEGVFTVWAPASQEGSHVGHAGVGIVSLKGAPIAMPSFATGAFQRYLPWSAGFECLTIGWEKASASCCCLWVSRGW